MRSYVDLRPDLPPAGPDTQRDLWLEHIAALHRRNDLLQEALDKLVNSDARATLLQQEKEDLERRLAQSQQPSVNHKRIAELEQLLRERDTLIEELQRKRSPRRPTGSKNTDYITLLREHGPLSTCALAKLASVTPVAAYLWLKRNLVKRGITVTGSDPRLYHVQK